ncbi:hypothetical protein Q2941_51660 [Bradyrhizobium sp. UFLA05-153]
MRRRIFIAVAGGMLAWPFSSAAQSLKSIPRLCFLTFDPGTPQSPAKRFEGFFERLRELGYVNGETITIDYLHPEGRSDRYPELASECLHRKPDIIAVTTTPGAHALKDGGGREVTCVPTANTRSTAMRESGSGPSRHFASA